MCLYICIICIYIYIYTHNTESIADFDWCVWLCVQVSFLGEIKNQAVSSMGKEAIGGRICVCVCVFVYIYIYAHTVMYVCIYIHTYVCMYVCECTKRDLAGNIFMCE